MMTTVPISLRLREYHSISPKTAIPRGGPPKEQPEDFFNDGIMRAWIPDGWELRETNGKVRVHDGNGMQIRACEYVRWQDGRPNGHDPSTCKMCVEKVRDEARALAAQEKKRKSPSDMDSSGDEDMADDEDSYDSEERTDGRARTKRVRVRSPSARRGEAVVAAPPPLGAEPAGQVEGIDVTGAQIDGNRAEVQALLGPSISVDDLIDAEMKDPGASAPCDGVQDIIVVGEVRPFPVSLFC